MSFLFTFFFSCLPPEPRTVHGGPRSSARAARSLALGRAFLSLCFSVCPVLGCLSTQLYYTDNMHAPHTHVHTRTETSRQKEKINEQRVCLVPQQCGAETSGTQIGRRAHATTGVARSTPSVLRVTPSTGRRRARRARRARRVRRARAA